MKSRPSTQKCIKLYSVEGAQRNVMAVSSGVHECFASSLKVTFVSLGLSSLHPLPAQHVDHPSSPADHSSLSAQRAVLTEKRAGRQL